ncbi:hypothetical protein EHQ68_09195 [Leptospira congkakensis]|uniref:Uncharacterized protein n=1 Tax=Leptospira congkakensis TaxID=2484932 RepID=A0A4Z1AB24_9LEPT|nr:hypothetical protein [Leptospira congkakensis]TGL88800.1 hypothetical protein EHQ69_15265 [Leptospira congkakensis]TGL89386.1 hypothetical protein EHQ68_09195 [Leptospira congkakensis]TGL97354.1 hypothetical protein EHQ70_08690 [Leptospira congkakensis]
MKPILLISIFLCLFHCKKKDSSNTDELLIGLYLLQPNDLILELGYPGSQNQIQNSELVGKNSGVTVKVGGVAATGVSAVGSDTIQFTMPTIPGIFENSAVDFAVERNGAVVYSTKVRYRPLLNWPINEPNGIFRPIDGRDNKSFYQITATTAIHTFNTFGHDLADLDIYYFTSLNGTLIPFAEKRRTGAEFNRVSLNAGTVYVMVKHVDGLGGTFNLQVANSGVVASSSDKLTYSGWPFNLCYDTMGTGPATTNNCLAQMAVYNPTRRGRCTYPGDKGLTTRNYYAEGGFANQTTNQNGCLFPGGGSYNEAEAIFILD